MLKGSVINTIDHDLVIRMYVDENHTVLKIADRFNISDTTVKRILKAYQIPMRSRSESQSLRRTREKNRTPKEHAALKAKLIHLYWDRELSAAQCGAVLKMTGPGVIYWMSKLGIERRNADAHKTKWDMLDADLIVRLYVDEQQTLSEIANRFDVSPPLIAKVLEHRGIPRRTISEARTLSWHRKQAPKACQHCPTVEDHETITIQREAGLKAVEVNREMTVRELRDAELTLDQISEITGMSRVDIFQELQP